jgi:hypothetical protein
LEQGDYYTAYYSYIRVSHQNSKNINIEGVGISANKKKKTINPQFPVRPSLHNRLSCFLPALETFLIPVNAISFSKYIERIALKIETIRSNKVVSKSSKINPSSKSRIVNSSSTRRRSFKVNVLDGIADLGALVDEVAEVFACYLALAANFEGILALRTKALNGSL